MVDRKKLNCDLAFQYAGAHMSQVENFNIDAPLDKKALEATRAFCEAYKAFENISDEYIASILEE